MRTISLLPKLNLFVFSGKRFTRCVGGDTRTQNENESHQSKKLFFRSYIEIGTNDVVINIQQQENGSTGMIWYSNWEDYVKMFKEMKMTHE